MADEVVERVVDRQRGLCRLGQTIEVGQNLGTIPQLIIELTTGAELEQIQRQPPPGEESGGVGAGFLDARIRQACQPGVQLREEMSRRLDQGTPGGQGRPALSFSNRARARSRATES